MGRLGNLKTASDDKASRQRILDTATELLARYGFEGMSMQLLADQVGLHKSTLFHYFPGKDELVREVVHEELAQLVEALAPLDDASEPVLEQLVDTASIIADHFAEKQWTARVLVRSMINSDNLGRSPETEPLTRAVFSILGRWLERAGSAGVIRPVRTRHALINLMGLLLFYPAIAGNDLSRELIGGDPLSPRAVRGRKEELAELIRAALAP